MSKLAIVLTMPIHLNVQNSKYSIFSPSDIPANSNSSPRVSSCRLSSLGENKLISVKDTIRNLNVKPMQVSSAQAISCTRFMQNPE
jgi:hypothetical protein